MGANRAESIRHTIEERPLETVTGSVAVSMSFGVAGTEDWQDSNAEQLIKEADVALLPREGVGQKPLGACEAFWAPGNSLFQYN